MNHTQYCRDDQCNKYCPIHEAEWLKYQHEMLKGFDFGEMFLRQSIGIRQEQMGIIVEIMRDEFNMISGHRGKTTDTILEAIRHKYPRIRFNDGDLTFLKRAYLRHNSRHYRGTFRQDLKRMLGDVTHRVSNQVLPSGKNAYYIRDTSRGDKDYSFEIQILPNTKKMPQFPLHVKFPKNYVAMYHHRKPFIAIRQSSHDSRQYEFTANGFGLPLDLHLNPNPKGWVPVTVFGSVSPRRMGNRKIFVTRYKNIPAHVARADLSLIRWTAKVAFENDNPFVFSETEIPLD
jgi:hypothetical protein